MTYFRKAANAFLHSLRRVLFLLIAFVAGVSLARARGLPTRYDLREQDLVPPVMNQGMLGTCWAFSNTLCLESSILRRGLVASPTDPRLDLSVWHLATANGMDSDLSPPYDNWGGITEVAVATWTRGQGVWHVPDFSLAAGGGPVLTATNPKNAYPLKAVEEDQKLRPYVPPANQTLAPFRLTQAIILKIAQYKEPVSPEFRDQVKQLLLDNGAISTAMFAGNETPGFEFPDFYDRGNFTYRCDVPSNEELANHAVSLIGWDDDKVVTVKGVSSTGAWLIQNSWGEGFGDHGCFWIAYDDIQALKDNTAYGAARRGNISAVVMENQIFAPTENLGPPSHRTIMAAEKLTSTGTGRLAALGLWSQNAETHVGISIYSSWTVEGPSGLLLAAGNYTINHVGYEEITLPRALALPAGKTVYVVFDFGHDLDPVSIDTDSNEVFDQGPLGVSWYSIDDGQSWKDLARRQEHAGIFFLKGLVELSPPTISLQPKSQAVKASTRVSFLVKATGPGPLSYQWKKDGVNLPGQTKAALVLYGVTKNAAGSYRVLVRNQQGQVLSAIAKLKVRVR